MTLYLTFPVAMFWIANQAEWFEDYVIQRKVGIDENIHGLIPGGGGERGAPTCWGAMFAFYEPTLPWVGGLRKLLAPASSCYFVPTEGAVAT